MKKRVILTAVIIGALSELAAVIYNTYTQQCRNRRRVFYSAVLYYGSILCFRNNRSGRA